MEEIIDLVIAIDAGGTEIKAGLVQGAEIIDFARRPTEREMGPDHARDRILAVARDLHELHPEARALGLVVPGVVDSLNGIAVYSENLLWRDIPFKQLLSEMTGLPIAFGHDVRAGGLAESVYGSGVGYLNSLFLTIGTGISGAMILNGEMYQDVYSGELGHFDVSSGVLCACGATGCLETVSTGPSIARTFRERSGKEAKNSAEVLSMAKSGDHVAEVVWNEAMLALAKALMAYINVLAPEIIILGGGLSQAGDDMVIPIEKYLDSKITFQRRPIIAIAELGDRAGMIGAGVLAMQTKQ